MTRNRGFVWLRLLAVAIPATLLWFLVPRVPFSITSYTLWACLLVLPLLVIAVIRPIPALWLTSRAVTAVLLLGTTCLAAGGWLWPLGYDRVQAPESLLDKYMPEYNAREFHRVRVRARPDQVWSALRTTTFREIPVISVLSRARGVAYGRAPTSSSESQLRSVLASLLETSSPFFLLEERSGEEMVIGLAGRPWQNSSRKLAGGTEFLQWKEPDSVRVATNFRLQSDGEVSSLITETRIRGTDDDGTRHFGRYWRLVYPGSAVIRHQLLEAVAANSSRF